MRTTLLTRTALVLALVVGVAAGTTGAAAAAPARPDAPSTATSSVAAAEPRATVRAPLTLSRVAGNDPYAVSVAASKAAFATGTHPPVVYLVSGTSPWHALSATPAAVRRGGGVLMSGPGGIPSVVTAELARLAPASIVVVGDTSTLSDAVLGQAERYARDVRRVGGASRYQSSLALVRDAFATGSGGEAWLATGETWPDGVAAGAAAASQRSPLLTVDGRASRLPSATVSLIRDLSLTSITIVGGPSSVSPGIQAELTGLLGEGQVTRASAKDHYALAVRVNRLAHPSLTAGPAYVASGRDAASAQSGGFLAGQARRPLLYTLPFCVPASVRPTLASTPVVEIVLIGGEGSLRGLVGTLEGCRSIENPASPWALVNKRNALTPRTFAPPRLVVPPITHPNGQRLRADAGAALALMFAAAKKEGAGQMSIVSGYRSYSSQSALHQHRVSTHGTAYADRWIARPGHSEHQSGLALDLAPVGSPSCSTHSCLGSTAQGVWVRENAWRFGFVLRYEKGSTRVSGYNSEPWHLRFVGTPLSTGYHRGGWHTLEQFLGEPAAPAY